MSPKLRNLGGEGRIITGNSTVNDISPRPYCLSLAAKAQTRYRVKLSGNLNSNEAFPDEFVVADGTQYANGLKLDRTVIV